MSPNAQVAELIKQYENCAEEAAQFDEPPLLAELTRRPAAGSWSAAECFAHLNICTEALLPLLRAGIGSLRDRGQIDRGPLKLDLVARLLKWVLEPPPRMRSKTPSAFVPSGVLDPSAEVARFIHRQGDVIALLRSGSGLALDREKILSPFAKNVKYGVWSAFVVCVAHQRRHIWQAKRAAGL